MWSNTGFEIGRIDRRFVRGCSASIGRFCKKPRIVVLPWRRWPTGNTSVFKHLAALKVQASHAVIVTLDFAEGFVDEMMTLGHEMIGQRVNEFPSSRNSSNFSRELIKLNLIPRLRNIDAYSDTDHADRRP